MDEEATCLRKLTKYAAWNILNCPPHNPTSNGRHENGIKKREVDPLGHHEVRQVNFIKEEEIIEQIKRLNDEGRRMSEITNTLSSYQQDQLTALVDKIASENSEPPLEWSLAQLEISIVERVARCRPKAEKHKSKSSRAKPIKREEFNTVSMAVFLIRTPPKDLDVVRLYEHLQKIKLENLPTVPAPPPPSQRKQSGRAPAPPPPPPRRQRSQGRGTDTDERRDGQDPRARKVSQRSGQPNISGTTYKKCRTPRPRDSLESLSNESYHNSDGSVSYSYLDDVIPSPRARTRLHAHSKHKSHRRTMERDTVHSWDAAAFQAGFEKGAESRSAELPAMAAYMAERYGTAERILQPRVIKRIPVIEPRSVISYGPSEPRYFESSYFDDREIDAERLDIRREPLIWTNRRPFPPYNTSSVSW
jgi:hypothetical protein